MRVVNVVVDDEVFARLDSLKGSRSWRVFLEDISKEAKE